MVAKSYDEPIKSLMVLSTFFVKFMREPFVAVDIWLSLRVTVADALARSFIFEV